MATVPPCWLIFFFMIHCGMISLPAIKLPRWDSSHFLFLHYIFLLVILFHSHCFPNLLKTFWVLGISPKLFGTPIQIRNVPGFFWLPLLFSKSMPIWNGKDAPLWILVKLYLVGTPRLIVHYRKISESISVSCVLPWSSLATHKWII